MGCTLAFVSSTSPVVLQFRTHGTAVSPCLHSSTRLLVLAVQADGLPVPVTCPRPFRPLCPVRHPGRAFTFPAVLFPRLLFSPWLSLACGQGDGRQGDAVQ